MLDEKQSWAISLFVFKMDHKAAETTCSINNAFDPGSANERTLQWWLSFPKEIGALKKRNIVVGHWKMTMTNWKQSLRLILLQLHEKLPKNLVLIILWSSGTWSKLERWKGFIRGYLMSWPEKIKSSLCSVIFSYSMQQQWTISQSDCDMWCKVDFIQQPAVTQLSG